jgi:hypothetical protein
VLIVSSDLSELILLCHRISVVVDGRVIATLRRDEFRSREPAVTDHIGNQDGSDLSGLAHGAPSGLRERYHRSQLPGAGMEADYSGNPNIRAPRIIFSSRAGM